MRLRITRLSGLPTTSTNTVNEAGVTSTLSTEMLMETISFESSHESVVTLFSAGFAKRCTDRPRIVPGIAIRAMTRMAINGQRRRRDRE